MGFIGAAVGAIGSAIIGGVSSSKAASAQERAAQLAVAEQRRQYDQTRQDQMPWLQTGGGAITTLGQMVQPGGELYKNFTLADFQKDPGYDFRLQEGEKALQRSAAARGSVLGGGTLKDLTKYNSDYASGEINNARNWFQLNRATRYNQLAGVAGAGQQSANTLAAVGQNTANQIGNAQMYSGNARASGYMGIANAINGGTQGIFDAYSYFRPTSQHPNGTFGV